MHGLPLGIHRWWAFTAKFASPTHSSKPSSFLHEASLIPPFKLIPPSYIPHVFYMYPCGRHGAEPLRSPSKSTRERTVKDLSWLAPSDLLQSSRQGLSWLLPPNNEAKQGTGAWIFLPIMKLSAGQSLLWAPNQPGRGFLGAALQFEVPSKQLSFLSHLFAQGPDLH